LNFLSSNLKFLRSKNNLNQEDIAKVVGKARSLVSQWESDDREITTEDIIKLSDYFGVSMDSFVGKDLRNIQNNTFSELELLFDKYKNILTENDEEHIKFIIEQRIKDIDKEKENE